MIGRVSTSLAFTACRWCYAAQSGRTPSFRKNCDCSFGRSWLSSVRCPRMSVSHCLYESGLDGIDVRDSARLLNVSEKTIYRWVKQGKLPAYRINEQYRFNRAELLEWATSSG